jgi:hypothetical protein
MPPPHLSRLALDEAAVAAPPPEVAAHLGDCVSCRTYVQTLRANAAEFLRSHPSERFLSQIALRPRRRPRLWLAVVGLPAAAAVAFAVLALRPGMDEQAHSRTRQPGSAVAVALKGPLVSTFVQRQGEAVALRAGDVLHPKDALRFVVRSEEAGYAAVFERDPDGKVTVVAPYGAAQPQAVSAGSTALADSAVLDSTLGRDRFVAIFSAEPFEISPVIQALSSQREIACPGCRVEALEYDKSP